MEELDPQLFAALLQQIQGAQAPQQPDPLASMSPEQIAQYAGMGSLDDRAGLAQQQQARADALRNYEAPAMLTPGGAIGAGVGDLAREIGGGVGGMRAQGQMQDVLGKQDAGRQSYMEALAALLRGGAPDEKTVDLSGLIAGGGF
jgi:hypothetical protein